MRGDDEISGSLFSYIDLKQRAQVHHPLREIANAVLDIPSCDVAAPYLGIGGPSITPQKQLRAMLLQTCYSVRSERQSMERIEFDPLFRWFVGLGIDDPACDHSSFYKNRDRLLAGDIAAKFLAAVLSRPRGQAVVVERAFLGRRYVERRLGLDESVQSDPALVLELGVSQG
jgi:transposase